MEKKIRVGAVSYLNTKPLLYGLERLPVRDQIMLSVDYPSAVARQLKKDEIDIGLVPVAILPELKTYHMDAAWCIGANGPVGSVGIYSDVPLAEVDTLLLDYQSRTSVALAGILLKEYWKLQPALVPAFPGYQELIRGKTAGVVIGDRAFLQKKTSTYEYDLAEAWKNFTGLPFVFATWVANKPLPAEFMAAFDAANGYGLERLEQVVADIAHPHTDLLHYYRQQISYPFDPQKRKGLELFLRCLKTHEPLPAVTL